MAILLFLLGAILGSFYLVIGTRLPIKENVITGRSRCDHCHHELVWYELIPILSYLFLLGKCRYCSKKISINHLLIELITGFLFLYGYLCFNNTIKLLTYLTIISVAIIIFISDMKYMIILDSPLVIGSIIILILRYFELGIKGSFYSFLYGVLLFIFMYIVKLIGNKAFKKESLGDGDIKLSFLIGLTLGYPGIGFRLSLISIIFAAFLALPYAIATLYLNKKNELPFGPFLISSMIIIFIFIDKFKKLFIFFLL